MAYATIVPALPAAAAQAAPATAAVHAAADALAGHLVPALGWLLRTTSEAAVVAALVLVAQAAFGRWLTPAWRHRL